MQQENISESLSENIGTENIGTTTGESKTDSTQELKEIKTEALVEIADPNATATVESTDTPTTGPRYAQSLAAEPPPQRQTQLTRKEMISLKNHKYGEAVKKFSQSFVVLNKKTGMVVEMRAASAWHAITMIGWRHKNCRILQTINHIDHTIKEEKVEIVEIAPINTSVQMATGQTETITVNEEPPVIKE